MYPSAAAIAWGVKCSTTRSRSRSSRPLSSSASSAGCRARAPPSRARRDAPARFATGVTVVTVNDGGEYRAMTANSFTSVSLDPLLILISVTRDASMHDPIHEAGNFAVNILAADQRPAAELFARRGELTEPMGGIPFHVGGTGAP